MQKNNRIVALVFLLVFLLSGSVDADENIFEGTSHFRSHCLTESDCKNPGEGCCSIPVFVSRLDRLEQGDTISPTRSIRINDPILYETINPGRAISMGAEGRPLVFGDFTMAEFNPADGKREREFTVPKGFVITAAAYLPGAQLYVACAYQYSNQKSYTQKVFFYDADSYLVNTQVLDVNSNNRYLRQIIVESGGLHLHFWERNPRGGRSYLYQGELANTEKGPVLRWNNEPYFGSDTNRMASDHKRYWLVEEKRGHALVNQSERGIHFFSPAEYASPGGYTFAALALRGEAAYNPVVFDRRAKIFSITRVTGFYKWKNGYLIGYETPNSNHHFYGGQERTSSLWILRLELLNHDGASYGQVLEIPGSHLIGVINEKILTLTQINDEYALEHRLFPKVRIENRTLDSGFMRQRGIVR